MLEITQIRRPTRRFTQFIIIVKFSLFLDDLAYAFRFLYNCITCKNMV